LTSSIEPLNKVNISYQPSFSLYHIHKISFIGFQSKKDYVKTYKESELAQQKFLKANADRALPRIEVDKARDLAAHRAHLCEDDKNAYLLQLRKTNEAQAQHFKSLLPTSIEVKPKLLRIGVCLLKFENMSTLSLTVHLSLK